MYMHQHLSTHLVNQLHMQSIESLAVSGRRFSSESVEHVKATVCSVSRTSGVTDKVVYTWSSTDTLSDVGLLSTGEDVQEVVSRVVTLLTHIACSGPSI